MVHAKAVCVDLANVLKSEKKKRMVTFLETPVPFTSSFTLRTDSLCFVNFFVTNLMCFSVFLNLALSLVSK